MSLTLTLDPHDEQLIAAQLNTGRYHSPEEVLTRALEKLAESEPPAARRMRSTAEAVAHIRQSRKGVTLSGIKVKDLIDEGRK